MQQKFDEISHLIWILLSKRQINREISSIFLAFLEYLNFTWAAIFTDFQTRISNFPWIF